MEAVKSSLTVMQDQILLMKAQPEAKVGRSVECRRWLCHVQKTDYRPPTLLVLDCRWKWLSECTATDIFICMAPHDNLVISMALTPPKKYTWYLCILLWLIGLILAFGGFGYAAIGAALLALSGLISILAVYLKGL